MISTSTNRDEYTGNGTLALYPYTFKIFSTSEMTAYLDGVLTTDYALTGVGDDSGGNLTFTTAPADTVVITLLRSVTENQSLDIPANSPMPEQSLEDAFDKLTMIAQQISEKQRRAFLLPVESALSEPIFPDSPSPGSKLIRWNAGATALELVNAADVGFETIIIPVLNQGSPIYGVSADTFGQVGSVKYAGAYAGFETAVSTIGATVTTLIVTEVETIADNLTTPSTLHVVCEGLGEFSVNASKTLTINGSFDAPQRQVFSGAGSIAGLDEARAVWFGAVGDGVTDDRTSLFNADQAGLVTLSSGSHKIDSNLTFTNTPTFEEGAILKPTLGVVITFLKWPQATEFQQIFDLSVSLTGTSIVWPVYDKTDTPAYWFGAIPGASGIKSDQQVEIQYAIDSRSVSGGVIKLVSGDYYCEDAIQIKDRIIIRGPGAQAGCNIRVAPTWGATAYLIVFQRADITTASAFEQRLESLAVRGEGNATLTRLIWARSWNEWCGMRDIWVDGYMQVGLQVTDYYGGSASSAIKDIVFFADATATHANQIAIDLQDPGFSSAFHVFSMENVVAVGNSVNGVTNHTGISAAGRVRIINNGSFHVEDSVSCVTLDGVAGKGSASFEGIGPQATGNATVDDIFQLGSLWFSEGASSGVISCTPPKKGGAIGKLVTNFVAGQLDISASEANPFVYPIVSTRSTSGAIALRTETVRIETGAGAIALTLADGYEGERKYLMMAVDGGGIATLTPANFQGASSTITFDDVFDDAYLIFIAGEWIFITGSATVA